MTTSSGRCDDTVASEGTRFIPSPAGDGSEDLVHEPAKQSHKAAKLDLLTLEPGIQSTVGDGGRRIAAIKRVCLVDDGVIARMPWAAGCGLVACGLLDRTGLRDIIVSPCVK